MAPRETDAPPMIQRNDTSRQWLGRSQLRFAVASTLATCLLLGAAVLLVDSRKSSSAGAIDHPGIPLSDAATEAHVVESARGLVAVAGLRPIAAGYLLMSCKNREDPPYQGAIYLTFTLPVDAHADTYFRAVASTLVQHGWTEGRPPAEHVFGRTLTRDDTTAVLYRHRDDPTMGVLRLYGPCRNTTDHRRDTMGWTDISDQFGPLR
ncbi:hypothetical protein OSH39_21875 [Mycobacterium ulcerans]|nr:hypothetical protein [Mycobacterium ulcerans]MEB3906847.1 hypothetical protein [Mycobacterium ulcerans]MEB3910987.1 hypothetical protein [Mycobacterium ulcerans]MEB3921238.1 hypothetical protein [Mycobacterium ulcerans]MEB3925360.1 hypothetical protein [Mycobacterium ulcerans]MEB3929501.1 hypothetical protein [Mycobacterium ulcerans]